MDVDRIERPVSVREMIIRFVASASSLALRGLGVAVLMGIVFGLVIGIGGMMMGVETERLYVIGGFSGWVSSFIAIMFVFVKMRRDYRSRH